jgi:CMP-N-acetylneuraminic acid synthetase
MVTIETLDHAIEYFEYSKLDSLFSVYKTPDFLFWNKDLLSVNYDYRNRGKRQDRGPTYLETGSFYLMKRQAFLQDQNQICGKFEVIGVPMTEAFELDSLDQLPFFEALLRHKDDIRNGTLWTK